MVTGYCLNINYAQSSAVVLESWQTRSDNQLGTVSGAAPWTDPPSYAGAHAAANLPWQLTALEMNYYQYCAGEKMY